MPLRGCFRWASDESRGRDPHSRFQTEVSGGCLDVSLMCAFALLCQGGADSVGSSLKAYALMPFFTQGLRLDAEEHTRWNNEALKRIGRAVIPLSNVDNALVRSDLELFT